MASKLGVTGLIMLLGGLAGATTAGITFWNDFGWVTQSTYRAEHVGVMSEQDASDIKTLLGDLNTKIDNNQDQWECDELDEEIPELELALLEATTNAQKVAINRKLEKKRERWDKIDCSRFTDLD